MSLLSWILIVGVLGFMLGWLLVWKIFQNKLSLSGQDWNNKYNKSLLGIKKLKKGRKTLETHLLASHQKIKILEEEKENIINSTKAHGIMFKEVISEVKNKNKSLSKNLTELNESNEVLGREAETQRQIGTQARKLESSHNKILQDLATFKEVKREEIEAIRSETQEIISDHEQKLGELASQLDEKRNELKKLKQQNSDLATDNQILETDINNISKQHKTISNDFNEYKLESEDNEKQAKLLVEEATSKAAYLKNKLKQNQKDSVATNKPSDTKTNLRTIQPKAAAIAAPITQDKSSEKALDKVPEQPSQQQSPQQQYSKSEKALQKAPLRLLKSDKGLTDDLKQIKGIGPALEKQLNKQGIYRFEQLAILKENDIEKINTKLNFKGRIQRDNWINQAQEFIKQKKAD